MREKFYVVGSFNVLAFDSDKKKKIVLPWPEIHMTTGSDPLLR